MADTTFINFYRSLDDALTERTSPHIKLYEVRGIQLLPNNEYPYVQATDTTNGIELEDWTVYVIDTCTGLQYDISTSFSVDRTFVDSNGFPQLDWSLTNVPYDLGSRMVYLKVTQLATTDIFYSNMFQLTDNNSEKTVRVDYMGVDSVSMKSIQLNMWYWQTLKMQDVSVYYETSTKLTRTNTIKSQKSEIWMTNLMSNSLFIKISDMMESSKIYFDLVRCNLFENIEIKELAGEQNFNQNLIKVSFDSSDTYIPLATNAIGGSTLNQTLNFNLS